MFDEQEGSQIYLESLCTNVCFLTDVVEVVGAVVKVPVSVFIVAVSQR